MGSRSFYNIYNEKPGSFVEIKVGDEYQFVGIRDKKYKIISILPSVNDTYNAEVQETSGGNETTFTETKIIKVNNTYLMYISNRIFEKIQRINEDPTLHKNKNENEDPIPSTPENTNPTPLKGGKRKQKRKTKYRRRRSIKHKKTRKV